MSRRSLAAMLVVSGLAVAALMFVLPKWPGDERSASSDAAAPPWALLDDSDAFERAEFPHEFGFPEDYGPHPGFRTEWWSLTGSLTDAEGRHLGVQLTMIRLGLLAKPPDRESDWAAPDVYAGVFSVSEPVQERLHTDVRASRAAVGLAGADAEPRQVWVEDWQLKQTDATALILTAGSPSDELLLTLDLRREKRLVDENEILDPDAEQSPPFHFYIEPRMRAEGSLRIGETEMDVRGTLSMEHAWGELPLPGGPVAVDRFTLHLEDGRELLLSRTHRMDGSGKPSTTGLLVESDGRPLVLGSSDLQLSPADYWTNEDTGARYPIRWSLRIPDHGLDLMLSPYYEDQAGVAWLPFWAGPMRISPESSDATTVGNGLAQLTGYTSDD